MAYLDPLFNTGRDQTRRTLATTSPPTAAATAPASAAAATPRPARGVLLPRRVRRLPRLPRAAAARGAPPPPPHGHPLLPHRLARGPLLQAAARRTVRPRVLPQRADLGLRLRRQAAPPLAAEARHDPRLRQARAATTSSMPRRSTASPTWRPASSRRRRWRVGSAPPTSCGTRSSPPPGARRPATRPRSPRGCCGASSRPRVGLVTCAWTRSPAPGRSARSAASLGRRYLLMDASPGGRRGSPTHAFGKDGVPGYSEPSPAALVPATSLPASRAPPCWPAS